MNRYRLQLVSVYLPKLPVTCGKGIIKMNINNIKMLSTILNLNKMYLYLDQDKYLYFFFLVTYEVNTCCLQKQLMQAIRLKVEIQRFLLYILKVIVQKFRFDKIMIRFKLNCQITSAIVLKGQNNRILLSIRVNQVYNYSKV